MLNARINQELSHELAAHGLAPLPDQIIDRDGRCMDVSGDVWRFNIVSTYYSCDWSAFDLIHPVLAYAMKRYVIYVAEQSSPQETANTAKDLRGLLSGTFFMREAPDESNPEVTRKVRTGEIHDAWINLQGIKDLDELNDRLFEWMGQIVQELRNQNTLYRFTRIRAWYVWAAEMLSDLGFSEEWALELMQIHVPGNVKGRAVETEDEEGGPLTDEETRLLRLKLQSDTSQQRDHVLQRAAVALSLAFGRNPANYILLREDDFSNLTESSESPSAIWSLKVPRIKKRGVKTRGAFIDEHVDSTLAPYIQALLEANRDIDTGSLPRPLFMRESPLRYRLGTDMAEYAYHLHSDEYTYLIKAFARRLNLVSPRTGNPLVISARRLRYTFATMMVEQGVSREDLARMLDHSDTQHVQVYFALKGKRLLKYLDKAAAIKLAGTFGLFKGKVVASDAEAVNGANPAKHMYYQDASKPAELMDIGVCGKMPLCRLDPPYSCYPCNLFQPYREVDHEAVLDDLLKRRAAMMERGEDRLGPQLDDVILAVAQVVVICNGGSKNDKTT